MPIRKWLADSEPVPGAPGMRGIRVSRDQWRSAALDIATAGGRLAALWASGDETGPRVHAVFLVESIGCVLTLPLADPASPYPGMEDLFPAAARMQRAIADLTGLRSTAADVRP